RLTQERGDAAAADLATTLARLVERTSVRHGGRPVKWLGDGVMFFFPSPGPGVVAALDMVAGVAEAGLPPAHVGLHAGPVIFQEGDYYGQTGRGAGKPGGDRRRGWGGSHLQGDRPGGAQGRIRCDAPACCLSARLER